MYVYRMYKQSGGAMSTDDNDLTGAGPALFRLVRFWSRRWIMRAATEVSIDELHVQDILVLDAVDAAARHGAEVSVTDVAYHLGLDHSGASRLVSAATEHGYLHRSPSSVDKRRTALTVTDAGLDLLTSSHAWQNDTYTRLTADWDTHDAAQFAHYLQRLAQDLNDLTTVLPA